MSDAMFFAVINYAVLPFWLLLVVAPSWAGTRLLVHSVVPMVLLGGTYAWLVATGAFTQDLPEGASLTSFEGVILMFDVPKAVLAGWAHYLVFDLFVGAWIARDAARRSVSHWLVIPALILTLLLGPVGLLVYLLIRVVTGRGGWSLAEGDA